MAALAAEPPAGIVPPAVSLIGIDKRFGAVHANRAVDLTIARGSIAGIVGENGAGKSTLMSILYGFYAADAGEIRIRGRPVSIRNSSDAIALGIGMVHQHFMLVDTFTVLENVMLGAEGGAVLAAGLRAGRATLERLERDYGLGVDPDALVGDLPVGAQQRVEILKALYRGAEILILDEPTGVLTPAETEQLFRILRTLKARGTTVILITHKLREIMAVTDRVVVMRAGAVVAERDTAATTIEELAELMVGRKVRLDFAIAPCRPGPVLLKAEHLRVRDGRGVVRLDEVSFELRAGEIVGVAGVSGNGQTELLEVLSGIRPLESGRLTVGDRVVTAEAPADPAAMRALGLAHVPEDRHRLGLVTAFAATESSVLGYQRDPAYVRGPFSDQPAMSRHCAGVMERYDVRPRDPKLRSAGFSGGNQQKLILGRELNREPKILLAGQPTRGLDIGAIEFVHRRLIERRDAGCAVLLVSVELEEILSLSDRILVMCGGRIAGQLDRAEADERKIGLLMAGAQGTAQAA